MSPGDRSGFVRFQQDLARRALHRGELGAARGALRVLRTSDFQGGAAACEAYFAILRDSRATEEQIRDAIAAIIHLRPSGVGMAYG